MAKKKDGPGYGARRIGAKGLTKEQQRFNRSARKKGPAGSTAWKRYVFGHRTNVRKGKG